MEIIRTKAQLRTACARLREGGRTIALVPTMGALHDGHMALVREAAALADHVAVSIFVNPRQFGANEDLDAYPRQEEADAALLRQAGVEILWAPGVEEIYPRGFATNISVAGVSEGLCGGARPGHFDGVATIVCKLFNQVRPDIALFGEKDYQQLAVIRRMAEDLDMDLDIRGVPTQREADGLALSSRNAYLDARQREQAAVLPKALRTAIERMRRGEEVAATLDRVRDALLAGGFDSVDYVELRDADTLAPLDLLDSPARILAAARIGRTRLIDNMAVDPIP